MTIGSLTVLATCSYFETDTSYVLWQYCMLYPEARDICDIAAKLFVGAAVIPPKLPLTDRQPGIPRIAYEATAIMLLLNNIFLSKFMRSHRGRSG